MKFFIVLSVALACATAASISVDEKSAPIVKNDYEINPDGSFQYRTETGNGITSIAQGVPKNVNGENQAIEITGTVRYTSPDGTPVEFSYVANENGYQPQGNLLPVAPPTPEAILRSLEYIATHPQTPVPVVQYAKTLY